MNILRNLFCAALLLFSVAQSHAVQAPTDPLNAGAFTQEFSFTSGGNWNTSFSLSGSLSQFSSLSFELLNSNGTPVTSPWPAQWSIFDATPSGSNLAANFSDFWNPFVNLAPSTDYLILVSGVATTNGAQYSLWGSGLAQGSTITPVPAVPEPETYGMLLMGMGLIGFVTRRRKHG